MPRQFFCMLVVGALTCMHMQGPSHFSEGRRAAIRCELFPRGSPRTRTRNQSTAESVAETLAGCTGHTNGRDTITEEHFLGQACISEPRSGSRIFYGSHNRFPSQTECNLKLHQSFPWPSNPLSSCSELSIALQQNPAPNPAALRRPKLKGVLPRRAIPSRSPPWQPQLHNQELQARKLMCCYITAPWIGSTTPEAKST